VSVIPRAPIWLSTGLFQETTRETLIYPQSLVSRSTLVGTVVLNCVYKSLLLVVLVVIWIVVVVLCDDCSVTAQVLMHLSKIVIDFLTSRVDDMEVVTITLCLQCS